MLSTRTKVALATLLQRPVVSARRILGYPPILRVRRGGINWQLDLREGIDFSIWLLGAFERRTVIAYSRITAPGMVVLDVGANVGAHTLPLAVRVGETGLVYAFEPVRWAIDKLRANLDLNPDLGTRVKVHQIVLGARDDSVVPASLHASWPLATSEQVHRTLRARLLPTQGAAPATLDDFVSSARISRVDFIKIDVDGAECRVLRGARETLLRFRPAIVIELSPWALEEAGETLDSLLDLLNAADYRLTDLARGGPLPSTPEELHRLIPKRGGINALALPRSSR